MKFLLLIVLCFYHCVGARAQGADAGYAAPGMPIRVQGKVQLAMPRAPLVSPVLPRSWHLAGPEQVAAVQSMRQFFSRHLKYPATTLSAGISGQIHVHLTVLANGTVSQATITRRELIKQTEGEYGGPVEQGKAALDQEMLRVVQALRFKPSKAFVDTVTLVQTFNIQ